MWEAQTASLFLPYEGNTFGQTQSLANTALSRLARTRVRKPSAQLQLDTTSENA